MCFKSLTSSSLNQENIILPQVRTSYFHKPSGRKLNIMFSNLIIYLVNYHLLFYFISSFYYVLFYFMLINKIDILLDNIYQYWDTILGCGEGFEDYEYSVWSRSRDSIFSKEN